MSGTSGPVGGRRTIRRVKNLPPVTGNPGGNRAARRKWAKANPAAPKSNQTTRRAQNGPEAAQPANPDRETRDGCQAAHGAAGRHDGHSAPDPDTRIELPGPHPADASGWFHHPDDDIWQPPTERTETP